MRREPNSLARQSIHHIDYVGEEILSRDAVSFVADLLGYSHTCARVATLQALSFISEIRLGGARFQCLRQTRSRHAM